MRHRRNAILRYVLVTEVVPAPFVYIWRVGEDCYVGKANRVRRIGEYANNVRKLFAGQPYRKADPHGWRKVHFRLAIAAAFEERVTLELVPTTLRSLTALERRMIRELAPSLNDYPS